jgi:hypothetical protein
MLEKLKSLVTNDTKMSTESQRFASIIFLAIAGGMSFREYVHTRWLWDYHLTFSPGLISTGIAILMMAPLYLRGILKWNRSIFTTLSFVLILLVLASFIELALGGNGRGQFVTAAIGGAVVLSWLGIKEIAGVCWVLAFVAGLYSAISNNLAMGFYGYIYMAFGFLGLLLHSQLNPGQLVKGIQEAY